MSEIIGVAVQHLHMDLKHRNVTINVMPQLPLIQADFVLLEQALVNLLDNACRYTPEGTPLIVSASGQNDWLEIVLRDFGPGIPPTDTEPYF